MLSLLRLAAIPADGERLETVREDCAGDYLAGINCICRVGNFSM
ncbi:rCG32468, isoform CRA_a [Rattus norvegicus]|uniref:RCG32468, isoform CRA_a n=1 Tax=Rattus norvegicus TaxID=10116 RepID=A6HHL2_RAT|nr:rCG32468, isoform CRA_a [Rattus norvegicus]